MATVALSRRKYCKYVTCPFMERTINGKNFTGLYYHLSQFEEAFQSDLLENSGDVYFIGSKKQQVLFSKDFVSVSLFSTLSNSRKILQLSCFHEVRLKAQKVSVIFALVSGRAWAIIQVFFQYSFFFTFFLLELQVKGCQRIQLQLFLKDNISQK